MKGEHVNRLLANEQISKGKRGDSTFHQKTYLTNFVFVYCVVFRSDVQVIIDSLVSISLVYRALIAVKTVGKDAEDFKFISILSLRYSLTKLKELKWLT